MFVCLWVCIWRHYMYIRLCIWRHYKMTLQTETQGYKWWKVSDESQTLFIGTCINRILWLQSIFLNFQIYIFSSIFNPKDRFFIYRNFRKDNSNGVFFISIWPFLRSYGLFYLFTMGYDRLLLGSYLLLRPGYLREATFKRCLSLIILSMDHFS